MSCFCSPCRFESQKNPHFGAQKGAKYELYINIDGIFRVAHRFGIFVKMPAPGTFLCFASVIFPRRFVVMPRSRVCQRSFLRPPSSVSRFLALHRGAPAPFFSMRRHFSLFRGFPRHRLGVFRPAPGVPGFCSIAGRSSPPLGRSLSPAPGVQGFYSVVGRLPASPLGRSSPPLGRSLSPTPGVPGFCSVAGRLSAPTCAFLVSRAGRAGFLLHCRAGFRAADGSPSGNKRSRVLPGSGKHTESGGSSQMSFRRF